VAFQAKQIHIAAFQQSRIRGSMRRVARDAPFRLDWRVLEGKWTGLVRVAVEANDVLRGGGSQLPRQKAAVRVMAIAAFHQTFIHSVMKWL
jgi:hypothetical protein